MCRENKYNKLQNEVIYSILTNNKKELIGYQLNIVADGIRIRFPSRKNPMNYMYIIANIPKMLNKEIIEESDLQVFKEKYIRIVYERLFNYDNFLDTEVLNRIDYKFDYKCKSSIEKLKLLETLSKSRDKRYSANKRLVDINDSAMSLYYNSKYYRINIYDKEEESGGILEYENIVRYELQVMTGMMQRYFKKYGLIRNINNYWNMRNYFFREYLIPVIYLGDYYGNNIISRMLEGYKNKEVLMDKVILLQNAKSIEGIYSYSQLKQLHKLNINPLQNNFNMKNPLKKIAI